MATELTPCGALFETMKRYGGISHKDLARLVLSGRPLADGKSPLSRCDDRTWVSRFIVHAPVGSLQDRYFCDWGVAALRVSARLRSRDGKGLSAEEALSLVTNQGGALMEQALRECHQDLALYRNVERIGKELLMERQHKSVLSTNIDFYSGFMYRILGLPDQLFTPMFAVARMVGWSAHRLEELMNCDKIIRPAYQSVAMDKEYVPMKDRIIVE